MSAVLKPTATPAAESRFALIPIDALVESKTNPRRHFDKDRLAELAESVKAQGIVQPIVVRPDGDGTFEIVAGARRYRASKAAGLATVPAIVRELTDEAVLEIQTIENLQREDVHPLEEALGYQALLERAKYDVETISAKVGKSISYVYQRLKLLALAPKAQKVFMDDKITAGHAILIARLQPPEQREALGYCTGYRAASVRQLADWIEEHVHLDLHSAPFTKDDALLVAAAGPCTTCPKRTGAQPALFPDIKKKDTCTDPACFRAKQAAWFAQQMAALRAEGHDVVEISPRYTYSGDRERRKDVLYEDDYRPAGNKKCAATKLGLYVEGRERGKTVAVCTAAKCEVHRSGRAGGEWQRATVNKAHQESVLRGKARAQAQQQAIAAVVKKATKLDTALLREITHALAAEMWHERLKEFCRRRGWEPVTRKGSYGKDYVAGVEQKLSPMADGDLLGVVVELVLTGAHGEAAMKRLGKRYRIDPAALERTALAELKAQAKAAAAAKTKAKPKGKKVQTSAKKKGAK